MFGGTAFERDVDEEEFTNILFVPSNFRAQRDTTHPTPSSPSRAWRGTPGRTTSLTPPPPPLNLINEAPTDRSKHHSRSMSSIIGWPLQMASDF